MSVFLRIKRGIKNFLYDPEYKIGKFAVKHFRPELIPDRIFLKYQFHYVFGYKLDLKHPKTFNEKLQWLKLYDRNPLYTTLVDKYAVKQWVSQKIGEQHIIPNIAVFEKVEDIDINKFPDKFVLKCNHDSGSVVICKDKSTFDIAAAKNELRSSINNDFYLKHREWAYKNVRRCIIAEEFVSNSDENEPLRDYKFYCFNGEPKLLYVSEGLEDHSTARISFLTMDFAFAPFTRTDFAPFSSLPNKPEHFEEMKKIASILSHDLHFCRVDLYEIKGTVLFSEMTFYPCAGVMPINPSEWDLKLGSWINLPPRHK